MPDALVDSNLDPAALMEIIRTQTAIAGFGLDLGGVMGFVSERVQALTGATGAMVELAEGEDMVYRAASGMAGGQLGLRLKRAGSLSGLCVEQGAILRCDDSDADARVDREACRRVGLRSMVVAPLVHNGSAVGALKIASPVPAAFTDRDIRVLELMSGLIAAAMFNAVQHETSELYHRATHDALTGLANRALFYDRLRQNLALAGRQSSLIGVLNVDMDGLKAINDQHGHRAGDAAIREAAARIRATLRQSDTAARLGGDEFGVILYGVQDRDSAASKAERIAAEIRQPFAFEDRALPLDASVGVAVFPHDGEEMDALIEKADQSMYAVKRTRKGSRDA
ncbi:sensor domain-containing diguanylate cyclase [Azospirillum sp. TSO22-1]|uniref:sensor domain-containing diguanylate cyclase n=1 Tax=Azospirillum sp. TSO22-1 TaxID=716789 RepID=UPI001FFE840A|nr:sensor domain-containing diguanylate cyclase [Azospirillum sp. TSO22-1]